MGSPGAKALIVDFGGVLTTSVFESFSAFCVSSGLPEDALLKLLVSSAEGPSDEGPITRFERGEISDEEFEAGLASALSEGLSSPIDANGLKRRIFELARPDHVMREAVRNLRRAGVVTALLSNSWGLSSYNREALLELFDEIVISAEVGMRKPDPRIFLLTAERLDLMPSECVFVDDLEAHVQGAESVGMKGIVHRDRRVTLETLERLFEVPMRPRQVS